MRRAIVLALLDPVVVALAAPEYWEVGLRIGVAVLGALAAWALARRVWSAGGVPPELAPRRTRRPPSSWPVGADRLRAEIELASQHASSPRIDVARALRRTCRAIAIERLHAGHGIDLDRPEHRNAARAALGDDVLGFLEGGPMIDHARLVDALAAL